MTDQLLIKAKIRKYDRESNSSQSLCSAHSEIYAVATSEVFEAFRMELTNVVMEMGRHIKAFGPDEYMTLRHVKAIEEMWAKPWLGGNTNERWKYQADQCEACILSRIATDPSALRELQTLFLAHARENVHRPWPIIFTFVYEWIKSTDQAKLLFDMSIERAEEIRYCIHQERLHKKVKEAEEEKKKEEWKAKKQQNLETLPALSYNPTPLTQKTPNPLLSSTLNRPPSRDAYAFSEAEFLQEFSPDGSFYRTSSTVDDDDDITDIYSHYNDTRKSLGLSKTLADLQKQQIIDQYRANKSDAPGTGLPFRLDSPWSSTDEIRGSYSRFSQTTISSSPSLYSVHQSKKLSPPISPIVEPNSTASLSPRYNPRTPDRHTKMPVSPLASPRTPQNRYIPPPRTPKTPDRSRALLPIPEVSPFQMSPYVSSSSQARTYSPRAHSSAVSSDYSQLSAFSPGEEVVGTEVTMKKARGRVVHINR